METTNPYQTPESDLAQDPQQLGYDESPWYSPAGRLGRARYFLASIGYYFVFILVMLATGMLIGALNLSEQIMPVIMIPAFVVYFIFGLFLMIKRIHDIGWTAWLLLLLIIPLANLVMALLLLFKPGSEGENRYGLPPRPAKNAVLWVVLSIVLIIAIGILAAIAVPAFQQYMGQMPG